MATAEAGRTGESEQTLLVELRYPGETGAAAFTRADIVFTGVRHSATSYEVRLFFNNPGATADTPRTAEQRYAGRFTIFGHGGCYGDAGHCAPEDRTSDEFDLRPPHPLTTHTRTVTVTDALKRTTDEQVTVNVVAVTSSVPVDEM